MAPPPNILPRLAAFVPVALCVVCAFPNALCAQPPRTVSQAVDYFITRAHRAAEITPAPRATSSALARRLTLDLAGRIPASAELNAFLADRDPARTTRLVDRLMASQEFSAQMADRFNWLITHGDGDLRPYLTSAFQQHRGWDQIFRDILLADLQDDESALPYLQQRVKDSDRLTNEVSITFFGVNISCAKCHDHPLVSDWTQDHFYGLKSFFDRTFDNGGFVAERDFGLVSFKTTEGEERQAPLMFLTGLDLTTTLAEEPSEERRKKTEQLFRDLKKQKQPPPKPRRSLREQLVDVALHPQQNHFFARAIVNRVWHQLMGQGLVMPLDQMHSENTASHPELLEWLAADLRSHGYDLRRLIRGLVLSDTYQRSSAWDSGDRPLPHRFAVAAIRPISPRSLARSVSLATTDQSCFSAGCGTELCEQICGAATSPFSETFDQPDEDFRVSATEALFFSNSSAFFEHYSSRGLVAKLSQETDSKRLVRRAVGAILAREAHDAETELLGQYLDARSDRREQAVSQIVWSLLTSSEFRFNH